ncbi:MAG TPA: nitrite reductase (NAD(P)H) small subunit [Stellaceae bacterium]|nr:nitrite reductase (NAD(P)H) small subunit [Stellaceae bacterium]
MLSERWIEVGRLDDIPRRGSRRVTGPGAPTPIAIFRTADDQVFALVDRCPHLGGPLSEGIVQGSAVACPLHGWVIGLGDGQAEAPDEGCTSIITLKLVDDRIFMSVPGRTPNVEAVALKPSSGRAPKAKADLGSI